MIMFVVIPFTILYRPLETRYPSPGIALVEMLSRSMMTRSVDASTNAERPSVNGKLLAKVRL